jgi:hypothetical protein
MRLPRVRIAQLLLLVLFVAMAITIAVQEVRIRRMSQIANKRTAVTAGLQYLVKLQHTPVPLRYEVTTYRNVPVRAEEP